MLRPRTDIKTIDQYIAGYPREIADVLQSLRQAIHKAAPKATEAIKYGIPTFVQNGNLVHFGAYKSHIGFYPAPSGLQAFAKDLAKYESSKGAVRFPLGKALPLSLITKIVKYRVAENIAKQK